MQLSKIQIENFRSIKSQTVIFDHNCLVLVGKNEAGKSNILKAVAAVFGQYTVFDKYKRKRIDNEKINEYYVRAILKLSENDFDEILKRFRQKYQNTECITFKSGKPLQDYIKAIFHEFLLQIDIADSKEIHFAYWKYDKNDFVLENDISTNGSALTTANIATKFNLLDSVFTIVKELYKENPYNCHYWEYDNEHLLPNTVDIAAFCKNPATCISLQNIFVLCNRENITQEFADAKAQDGDYENLLEQVSKKATQTFQKIWKDFKDTSIQLRPNGTEITIKIVDKAKYACEDRSDGFKKFISILLMLSTQALCNKIGERDIILIDEPDQSLYPTSARYLRDELLKIAEKAKVIYSTHSPYMIDADCIDRHLIVEKKDDITTAKKQDKNAQFSNDELLKQAMGVSIFECLREKNMIFEGWLDKELFDKYCGFNKNKDFDNVGKVYLGGISGVETLVQLLILANKKFIIVADADNVSNNKRKEFCKNYKEFLDNWLSYADAAKEVSTMEDFLKPEYIEEHIKKEFFDFTYDKSKNAIENIESVCKNDKEKKQNMKNELVKNLSKSGIKEDYSTFANKIKTTIENL